MKGHVSNQIKAKCQRSFLPPEHIWMKVQCPTKCFHNESEGMCTVLQNMFHVNNHINRKNHWWSQWFSLSYQGEQTWQVEVCRDVKLPHFLQNKQLVLRVSAWTVLKFNQCWPGNFASNANQKRFDIFFFSTRGMSKQQHYKHQLSSMVRQLLPQHLHNVHSVHKR